MDYKSFIADFEKYHKNFNISDDNDCLKSILKVKSCQNTLSVLRNKVHENGFKNQNAEIDFFKNIKSIPLSNYIYYKSVIDVETNMPRVGKSKQKRFLKQQLKKLDRFFAQHIDFGHYVKMNYNHFDKVYFTRKSNASFYSISHVIYFEDPIFSTPKDMLLAEFKAYGEFIIYLKKKYEAICNIRNTDLKETSLNWTGNKIDLIELIYALHASGRIQNGIKDVATACESLFDIELGNYYRKFVEIRSRKIERTKFINTLKTNLIQRMEEADM